MSRLSGGPSGHAAKALPAAGSNKPLVDWECLFAAVRYRLRAIAAAPDAPFDERPQAWVLRQMQSQMLECVGALDQLHGTLAGELRRARQVELELAEAKAEIARMQEPLGQLSERFPSPITRRDMTSCAIAEAPLLRERVDQSMPCTPARNSAAEADRVGRNGGDKGALPVP